MGPKSHKKVKHYVLCVMWPHPSYRSYVHSWSSWPISKGWTCIPLIHRINLQITNVSGFRATRRYNKFLYLSFGETSKISRWTAPATFLLFWMVCDSFIGKLIDWLASLSYIASLSFSRQSISRPAWEALAEEAPHHLYIDAKHSPANTPWSVRHTTTFRSSILSPNSMRR